MSGYNLSILIKKQIFAWFKKEIPAWFSAVLRENANENGVVMKNNIVLIGMPEAGKSTLGVILAKELGYQFLDSDLLIQKRENRLLKEILEQDGVDGFLRIESEVNAGLQTERSVIATGGSVVYGEEAMHHLREIGTVIYLKLPYKNLTRRLGNLHNRGVVLRDGQTLRDLYEERSVLYEKYADIVVDESGRDIEGTLALVEEALRDQRCFTKN